MQKLPAWDASKVTSKSVMIRRAKFLGQTVRFITVTDWWCNLRFPKLRRIYGARCFNVTHYGGKSFGRYFKITQVLWTSTWYRDRMHASQNERRTRTSSSFGKRFVIRIPRARRPRHWDSIDDAAVPLERNLYGHSIGWTHSGKVAVRKFWLKKDGWQSLDGSACTFIANCTYACQCMKMS